MNKMKLGTEEMMYSIGEILVNDLGSLGVLKMVLFDDQTGEKSYGVQTSSGEFQEWPPINTRTTGRHLGQIIEGEYKIIGLGKENKLRTIKNVPGRVYYL